MYVQLPRRPGRTSPTGRPGHRRHARRLFVDSSSRGPGDREPPMESTLPTRRFSPRDRGPTDPKRRKVVGISSESLLVNYQYDSVVGSGRIRRASLVALRMFVTILRDVASPVSYTMRPSETALTFGVSSPERSQNTESKYCGCTAARSRWLHASDEPAVRRTKGDDCIPPPYINALLFDIPPFIIGDGQFTLSRVR